MTDQGQGPFATLLGDVARSARGAGAEAYLVGGAVRDLLLSRIPVDVDVALEGPLRAADEAVSALASKTGWSCEKRHAAFGTATLRALAGERVDVAVTREERYPRPGALPVVTPGVPIERDLSRRDFTIHAMARSLGPGGAEGPLLDPFGGEADLGRRLLRLLHEGSLEDDPTRVFRGARYAARLGFEPADSFVVAMERAVASGAFARVSGDRLRRSLTEVLSEENRRVALEILGSLGTAGALVSGWKWNAELVRSLGAGGGAEEAWARLLAPASATLRERIASRLNFSRALRRKAGCPT